MNEQTKEEQLQDELQFTETSETIIGDEITPEFVNVSYAEDGSYKIEVSYISS